MKTVLHLSSSSGPGGAERIVCALAASLDPVAYRSLVGLFRPGWLKDQCESRGITTYVMSDHGFMHWKWMAECYRLVKREGVDLIQAHEFDAIVHGWVVAKLAGIPMVATVHGKNYFWEKARRRWAYRLVSRYVKLVAVSEDLKRFIVTQTGINASRVQVTYNGVDETLGGFSCDNRQFKRELGIPEGEQVVGVVGNLYPVKGHKYLLDAIPQVLKSCPNTTFILIGRGELEVSLQAQARDLGIETQVRFLGFRQDIPKFLAIMDVFAMPSLSEGLSIALLEAMAAGKPVVVTRVGGNPELVVDGVTGLLVPPENSEGFAEALIKCLSGRRLAEQLGENGRKRLGESFTLSSMIRCYQRLYELALG